MQLLPWRKGQFKPFTSIPRIDWTHPLTFGLNSFIAPSWWGDPELISSNGRFVTKWSNGNMVTSPFGNGLRVPSGIGASLSFPLTKTSTPATGTGDYTIACLLIMNTFAGRNFFGQIATGDTGFFLNDAASHQFSMFQGGGSQIAAGAVIPIVGPVYAVVGTRVGSTITLYVNGITVGTASGATGAVYTAGSTTYYFGGYGGASDITDMTFLAWGGWNRALTVAEALAWSSDPYCFLTYPEDEIFAMRVGAAVAAPIQPAAPLMAGVRVLPGLGPGSRHVALLNASLPAPAVAVTISGNTLPMMGVG